MTRNQKLALLGIAIFLVPIFRSGGRKNLTFASFVINHTIFGPPVEYVPEEDYMAELSGTACPLSDTQNTW